MRKIIYVLLFLLFCSARASAQFTLVTGTITDLASVPYSCATVSASIVNSNGQNLYLSGAPFAPQPSATKLGCATDPTSPTVAGFFSLQLADNTQIKCGSGASIVTCGTQTQWLFTINTAGVLPPVGTGPQVCVAQLTVSGTSQDISNNVFCPNLLVGLSIASTGSVNPLGAPYNAKFDARWTADGSITINSPIVTSATINFTSNDVGKKIYTVASSGGATHLIGTVASVQSATQATANANASVTESGSGLIVCTDDSTAIKNAWNTCISKNKLLVLPPGSTCVSSQLFAANGASFPRGTGFSVQGSGPGTILIMTPDFAFPCSAGTSACIWSVITQQFQFPDGIHTWPQVGNFSVTSMGSPLGGTAITLFYSGSNGGAVYHDLVINNFCSSNTGTSAIQLSIEDRLYNANIQGNACPGPAGTTNTYTAVFVNGTQFVDIHSPILAYLGGPGITVQNSQSVNIYGGLMTNAGQNGPGTPFASLVNSNGVNFWGTNFNSSGQNATGILVDGTSSTHIDGVRCTTLASTGTGCMTVNSGGKAYIGGRTQLLNGGAPSFSLNNSGTVFDDGSNTYATVPTGTTPTCVMTTGGGTGPACSVISGSTNEKGTVHMTPGTTPGSSGTTTITFSGTFGGATNTTPSCTFTLANTGTGSWNARGTAILSTRSTTVPVFAWDNNAVALTAASTYDVDYGCVPR